MNAKEKIDEDTFEHLPPLHKRVCQVLIDRGEWELIKKEPGGSVHAST